MTIVAVPDVYRQFAPSGSDSSLSRVRISSYRLELRFYMRSVIRPGQFVFATLLTLGSSVLVLAQTSETPALRPAAQSVTTTTTTSSASPVTTSSTSTTTTTDGVAASSTTTSTTTTTTSQPQVLAVSKHYSTTDVRSDRRTAVQLAKYHWLDKVAASDPGIVAAITTHYTAALELAKHPRIGEIAEADHYLCRRLTKWKTVARRLAKNGEADKVVALDPEGMYRAIRRDRATARRLVKNPMFDQMVYDNPDLGKLVAAYM